MRFLLTGGAGYIGSHTCVSLLDAGHEVVVLDNFVNSCPEAIARVEKIAGKSITLYEGDCCDAAFVSSVFDKEHIDGVVHFAGLKAVGESVRIPLNYYQNNLGATMTLCRVMAVNFALLWLVTRSCAQPVREKRSVLLLCTGILAESLLFAVIAAVPHRADGVNDIFAGQAVSPRELGLAGPAPAESPAFSQQLRPGRPVDAAVHAASAEQRLVGCIDNGVHAHSRDVVSNDNKRHDSAPAFDIFQARNAARPDRIWIAILYQLRLENARKHRKCAEVFREARLRGLRFSATIRKTEGSSDMSRTENVELAVVCLLEDGGRVLLQNRKKEDWHGWALPGGHVEPGESFVDAVSREMQEETGLTIRHPRLVGVKQFPIEAGRYVVLLFKAVEWSGTLTSSEEGEMAWIEYSKLPSLQTVDDLEEMLHMMNTPELTEFQYLLRGDEWIMSIK